MEVRRVLLHRTFLAALVLLLALNCFFFLYSQKKNGTLRSYADTYDALVREMQTLPAEEGQRVCQSRKDEMMELSDADHLWIWKQENAEKYDAVQQLLAQYDHLLGYEDYLERVQENAKMLQSVSIFSKPGSTSYKNTIKTAADFARMFGSKVTLGHDLAVTEVFADPFADYSILILMGVCCALFLSERREGLWPMIHAAPAGRMKLCLRRILTLLFAALIGTLVLLGSKILLSTWLYHGFGEEGRLLQSIQMFYNVPTPMTVGQFWALYLGVKFLGAFLLGLATYAILSGIANLSLAFSACALAMGAEFGLTKVPAASIFAPLRYCNLFSYIRFDTVFRNYLNLRFFGGMISGSALVEVLIAPLCAVLGTVCVFIACRKKPVSAPNRLLSLLDRLSARFRAKPKTLFAWEGYKLLWRRRGILILILLAIVAVKAAPAYREPKRLDMYTQFYEQKYAAPITDDTLRGLEDDLAQSEGGDRSAAISEIISRAQMLPEGSWIVPMQPYEAIWSNNYGNYHRATALKALLFLILLLSPIAAQERQAGLLPQFRATPAGRSRLWRKKLLLCLLMAFAVWIVIYGAELWHAAKQYDGFLSLGAPLYSLGSGVESAMPIWAAMTIYYLLKLAVLCVGAVLCLLLSDFCRRTRDALLLCTGVLLLPAALAAIGSNAAAKISLLLPLGGVEVQAYPWVYLLCAVLGVSAAVLSLRRTRPA